MNRRAISEAVSAVMLLGVVASVSFLALDGSVTNITDHETAAVGAMEQRGARVQELLSIISQNVLTDQVVVELINYGMYNITISSVFLDGVPSPEFVLLDSAGANAGRIIAPKQIVTLKAAGSGKTLQILTLSGNIIALQT